MLHAVRDTPKTRTSIETLRTMLGPGATVHVIVRAVLSRRGQTLIDVVYLIGPEMAAQIGLDVATILGVEYDLAKRGFFMQRNDVEPAIRLVSTALYPSAALPVSMLRVKYL